MEAYKTLNFDLDHCSLRHCGDCDINDVPERASDCDPLEYTEIQISMYHTSDPAG